MAMAPSEVSINAHDHGKALDERKGKVKCNYCSKVVSGFFRLKQHIGGIRGNVGLCERAPPTLKELMRSSLLERKKGTLEKEVGQLQHPDLPLKRNWYRASISNVKCVNVGRSPLNHSWSEKRVKMLDSISERCVVQMDNNAGSQEADCSKEENISSSRQVHKCIGRFFYETGLDISAADSPGFQRMMNASCHQIEFQIPSSQEMKGWILQDEVKEMNQYVAEIRQSWAATGCSILLDGWTDEMGRKLINFLIDCPEGTIYLRSTDISASIGDVDPLFPLLDGIIQEVGIENVIQIISYSASDCMKAVGNRLMHKYTSLFWTVSASHCLELMLKEIEALGYIREVVEKAKSLTKFIHNRATVLELLRTHTNGCDLLVHSTTKTASHMLTLENIVSEKEKLENMFSSSEWNTSMWASSTEGKRVAGLVKDHAFWSAASLALAAAMPLVNVLCIINENDEKSRLFNIYEAMDQAKETISDQFKGKENLCMYFWGLIDRVWNKYLHSALHSAGYLLNPSLKYSSDFHYDPEVGVGVTQCVIRLGQNQHMQELINREIDEYLKSDGIFRVGGKAMKDRDTFCPDIWWSKYGGHVPELQRFAIRILSQTCNGASRYRLNRHFAEKLLTKGRNRIEKEHLKDLTYLHYNLHLKNFKLGIKPDIKDKGIDSMHDWISDEAQDDDSQNNSSKWMDLGSGAGEATNEKGPSTSQVKQELLWGSSIPNTDPWWNEVNK